MSGVGYALSFIALMAVGGFVWLALVVVAAAGFVRPAWRASNGLALLAGWLVGWLVAELALHVQLAKCGPACSEPGFPIVDLVWGGLSLALLAVTVLAYRLIAARLRVDGARARG